MDTGFVGAIIALFLLLFGIYAGVGAGDILSKRCVTRGDYWRWNLIVLGIGVLATALVLMTGLLMLVMLVFGAMAGAVAGLKMGFGESVGFWNKVDRKFRVNRDQVRRAENPQRAEEVRRARREGREPELMSVQAPQDTAKKD